MKDKITLKKVRQRLQNCGISLRASDFKALLDWIDDYSTTTDESILDINNIISNDLVRIDGSTPFTFYQKYLFTPSWFEAGDSDLVSKGMILEYIPDITLYATQQWVLDKNYLTSVPDDYALKSWVSTEIANAALGDIDLTGYATESWVNSQGFLKTLPFNIDDYALKTWVIEEITNVNSGGTIDLTGYATESWVNSQGFIKTETDPTVPNYVKSITTTNISNWNTAFGWGDHSLAGYLKSSNYLLLSGGIMNESSQIIIPNSLTGALIHIQSTNVDTKMNGNGFISILNSSSGNEQSTYNYNSINYTIVDPTIPSHRFKLGYSSNVSGHEAYVWGGLTTTGNSYSDQTKAGKIVVTDPATGKIPIGLLPDSPTPPITGNWVDLTSYMNTPRWDNTDANTIFKYKKIGDIVSIYITCKYGTGGGSAGNMYLVTSSPGLPNEIRPISRINAVGMFSPSSDGETDVVPCRISIWTNGGLSVSIPQNPSPSVTTGWWLKGLLTYMI